ncbi:2-dehydropantoate 2-reductase [Cladophialophora yegresii CBS 114405]|uniref:2-dehydropantoate 2-reductase n=1 Tax=Cladophialophora yegresii CBS 114405 TaxID=1182544 RepID=W9W6I4_9EURO|nr:2-dehydropantoate 2-reductase [Cladophialophora yegresii CBS 114405]EXJ60136.1 2-dehydropantoate 2-reductase [Cladophialophora yegresii CBS 114405]
MPLEVLFFGAGAIGAFFASRVALSPDVNVSVVCRSNYKAVKVNGFQITSPQYGDYHWTPTRVFDSPASAVNSDVKWDYVVVSTKALPNISDDSKLLEGLITPGRTAIVLIQNGLGVEEPYASRFPDATILSAVTIASCAQPSNGHIKHNRWTRINIGPYLAQRSPPATAEAKSTATTRNTAFVHFLTEGGIKDAIADTHEKLQLVRWHKIAINAAMNPSAVLSGGSTNEAMSNDAELARHLRGVMHEVLTTAPKIVGVPFPASFATAEQILRSTRKNSSGSKPSMLLDWEGGKAMELEVILGNPIRIAREKGFEMPRTQSLYALLKMAERNREAEKERAATASRSRL